ncbi:MAG: DUF429 domain-containing protein [Candidatus Nanopelagicales bacterium]
MPNTAIAGIDGYPKGWVAAVLADHGITWRICGVHDLGPLIADLALVAIDIPIELVSEGWRACDAEAKLALGSAASRVFMTPPRAVLELGFAAPNAQVQELSLALTGQGVSRQAMALAERVLAVNELLPDSRLFEVHPELVFAELGGTVLPSKKSAQGVGRRIRVLDSWLQTLGTSAGTLLEQCPVEVPTDDALDALAALAGAVRIKDGVARHWPAQGSGPTIWA